MRINGFSVYDSLCTCGYVGTVPGEAGGKFAPLECNIINEINLKWIFRYRYKYMEPEIMLLVKASCSCVKDFDLLSYLLIWKIFTIIIKKKSGIVCSFILCL